MFNHPTAAPSIVALILGIVVCQSGIAFANTGVPETPASPLNTVSGDVTLQAVSPDAALDTLNQSISATAELPDNWHLGLGGSGRITRNGGFQGLNLAYVEHEWQLDAHTSMAVLAGRATINWSPWEGDSVVLSGHAPGIDQLQYRFEQGPAAFEKIVGRLSGTDRYLLAHRFTLSLGRLTGSVGETVVANGAFANNLVTLLPWPFYWSEWIGLSSGTVHNNDVNANAFLQATYTSDSGMLLGAELLVDDMPQWWGVKQLFQMAGRLRAEAPMKTGKLALQYTRVNNYTYAFQVPFGDYTQYGYSLGAPYGPDYDQLVLEYNFPRVYAGFTGVGLELRRKGAGRFGDVWEKEGYQASQDKQFLSGVVEQTQVIFAQASYPVGDNAVLNVRFGVGPIRNARNIAGYNKVHPEGAVELRYHFGNGKL